MMSAIKKVIPEQWLKVLRPWWHGALAWDANIYYERPSEKLAVWWYTTGLSLVWSWNKRQINIGLHQTGITFFMRHLSEPLYGDYTRSGRFLGLFFRFISLLLKSVLLLVRLLLLGAIDALYLIILPSVLAMVIYQFAPT